MDDDSRDDRVPHQGSQPTAESGLGPRVDQIRSVSLDHAAELLGVSRRTIYNRIREGKLVTIRTLGGSQRVLLESLSKSPEVSISNPSPETES